MFKQTSIVNVKNYGCFYEFICISYVQTGQMKPCDSNFCDVCKNFELKNDILSLRRVDLLVWKLYLERIYDHVKTCVCTVNECIEADVNDCVANEECTYMALQKPMEVQYKKIYIALNEFKNAYLKFKSSIYKFKNELLNITNQFYYSVQLDNAIAYRNFIDRYEFYQDLIIDSNTYGLKIDLYHINNEYSSIVYKIIKALNVFGIYPSYVTSYFNGFIIAIKSVYKNKTKYVTLKNFFVCNNSVLSLNNSNIKIFNHYTKAFCLCDLKHIGTEENFLKYDFDQPCITPGKQW